MCGIAGFIGQGTEADARRMIRTLHHRGPDDEGVYSAPGVALAHARLSIIDLSPLGHEPMWNASETVVLSFNGEIYNFRELREKYVRNYPFKGHSDAEVILAMYDRYGTNCFQYFEGMFAIVLWDTRSRTLVLARDRIGKKPLYIGRFADTFVFGSELKAVLAHPLAKKEIDLDALNLYLARDYVPTPFSMWKGIRKLEPGTYLVASETGETQYSFWNPLTPEQKIPIQDALVGLDAHLQKAVEDRLVSDVPLGLLLSGGLDSSTIAYYAKRASSEPLHTFSIGFTEKSFDESSYAAEVAKHLGTVHHYRQVSGEDALAVVPHLAQVFDEPLADASAIPTYILSSFAKENVSVALGGDGGDELFAGYPTFKADEYANRFARLSPGMQKFLRKLVSHLSPSGSYMSTSFKAHKFLEGVDAPSLVERHLAWLGTFSADERAALLKSDVQAALADPAGTREVFAQFAALRAEDPQNALLTFYEQTYLRDQVLVKVDRASMAHALEVRAPFLSYELVEFARSLPYDYKYHHGTTKYLLKKLMHGKLPSHIITRPKQGFGVPIGTWINGELAAFVDKLLAPAFVQKTGLFNPQEVTRLLGEHRAGKRDHRKKLWNLVTLLAWYDATH